jgi:hypothetical protein
MSKFKEIRKRGNGTTSGTENNLRYLKQHFWLLRIDGSQDFENAIPFELGGLLFVMNTGYTTCSSC